MTRAALLREIAEMESRRQHAELMIANIPTMHRETAIAVDLARRSLVELRDRLFSLKAQLDSRPQALSGDDKFRRDQEIAEAYAAGAEMSELLKKYRIAKSTVYQAVRHFGIRRRQQGRPRHKADGSAARSDRVLRVAVG